MAPRMCSHTFESTIRELLKSERRENHNNKFLRPTHNTLPSYCNTFAR